MTPRRREHLAALMARRVSFSQMLLISAASAIVSLVIVVSSMGETGPERAVIAALRAGQVVHAHLPASSSAGSAQPASDPSSSAAPASTPASTAGSGAGTGGGAGGSGSGSGSGNSGGGGGSGSGGSGQAKAKTPNPATRVKHVFVIALSTPSYAAAFGHGSVASYLNKTLRRRGELLSHYETLGGTPLPDLLAMVSGQAPNPDTRAGCSTYSEFASGTAPNSAGEVPGSGCIYPNTAITIGDQLDGADTTWRAYVSGMSKPCQHPNSGAVDTSQPATTDPGGALNGYATSENPFVYFHSLLDLGDCQSDDLPFEHLAAALKTKARTPGYAFIAPDACDAGAETTCANGKPGGLKAADAFLRRVVPPILASPAYRANGALLIVFTAGGALNTPAGTPPSTTTTATSTTTTTTTPSTAPSATSSGPLRTGALVLSRFTTSDSVDAHRYDPYSVLRSLEDIFGVSALAHAKGAGSFAARTFSASK